MMEVRTAKDVTSAYGRPVAVFGTLRRVEIAKGPQAWEGTGLVLDDGEIIYVSYRDPPQGWSQLLGTYLRVEGDLVKQASESEQSLIAPHLVRFTQPAGVKRELTPLSGQKVTLSGRAANAKAGAVVMVDLEPVYLNGVESWPREFSGKEVDVTGKLSSQPQWALDAPEWKLRK